MPFFTYILESQTTGRLYIGQTNSLEDRLKRHNSNQNRYTKGKGSFLLLLYKEFATRSEAVQLERKLKSWKRKQRVRSWVRRQKG